MIREILLLIIEIFDSMGLENFAGLNFCKFRLKTD